MSATVFPASAYADTGRPLDVPEPSADAAAHPEHLATIIGMPFAGSRSVEWASARTASATHI